MKMVGRLLASSREYDTAHVARRFPPGSASRFLARGIGSDLWAFGRSRYDVTISISAATMRCFNRRAMTRAICAPKSGQHKNMRTQDSMRADEPNQPSSPLFPAPRITQLLLDLKASLGQAGGQSVSYDDWAQIAGRPANTIASWCAGGAAHQLEVLLASLERLTVEERHRLIDRGVVTHDGLPFNLPVEMQTAVFAVILSAWELEMDKPGDLTSYTLKTQHSAIRGYNFYQR